MDGSGHHSVTAARSPGSWKKEPMITYSACTRSSIGMPRFCTTARTGAPSRQ